MSWITPLGFFGLASIAVLIIIYIIKPNYQQKMVSSTYVWKLSLQYRKKRLPVNRFRNILLFICQILILTACAFMLAQPFIAAKSEVQQDEKIVIIDASASMLSYRSDDKTRFDYAVSEVSSMAESFLDEGGKITVIIAGSEASIVVAPRIGSDSLEELTQALKTVECTYGEGDISGALDLAEDTLNVNSKAEVVLYTGTNYIDKGGIKVVDVSQDGEWNVAILGCSAQLNENLYNFTVDLACYGRDTYVTLYCDVYGVGDDKQTVSMSAYVKCSGDKTQVVEFNTVDDDGIARISSYEYAYFHVEEKDSFAHDNSFYLYGGEKETVKIQYCSTKANTFFETILFRVRNWFKSTMNIEIKEIQDGKAILEGYDMYIFEHTMPEALPTDGIVLMINPDKAPEGADIMFGDEVSGEFYLALGYQHPVIDYVYPERIQITKYKRILASDGYDTLMYCGGDPVFILKNDVNLKVGVLSFSLNNSTFVLTDSFPIMMLNLFKYFFPKTFDGYVFDVNEIINLSARGETVSVSGPGVQEEFVEFPSSLTVTKPGIYTVSQPLISAQEKVENFYVKIPATQSNIKRSVDRLKRLSLESETTDIGKDLLLYFAAVLVTLLFVEWILQSREQF